MKYTNEPGILVQWFNIIQGIQEHSELQQHDMAWT